MRRITLQALALFLFLLPAAAQTPEVSKSVKPFVRVEAAKVVDRKSTRLNSSHVLRSRMPSSA